MYAHKHRTQFFFFCFLSRIFKTFNFEIEKLKNEINKFLIESIQWRGGASSSPIFVSIIL